MFKRLTRREEDPTTRWFGRFYANHERMLWKLGDLDWDHIDRSQLDAPTLAAVRAAMLVESHNPVFASTLLGKFRHNFEMAGFLAIWTYEEYKHFAGLRAYLEATDAMPAEALSAELKVTRAGEWIIPDHYTDLMMASYAMLQELVTGIFYKGFAQRVQEPVLKQLLVLIGKDEYRHHQQYFDFCKQILDADRSRMSEVDAMLLEFEMPGPSFVPNYQQHGDAMLAAACVGNAAFREVLGKLSNLLGKWHIMQLAANSTYRQRLQENWGVDAKQILAAT